MVWTLLSWMGDRSGNPTARRASSGVQSTSTLPFIARNFHLSGPVPLLPRRLYARRPIGRARMPATITIETLDNQGRFQAYLAEPAGGTATAAIVVIQEIFGVNAGIRRKCDQHAEAGYLASAPDLFWRLEPGIELDPDIPDQFQAAVGWMG